MHQNFYHWHGHVDVKPETSILEARWAAAKNLSEEISVAQLPSLLKLVLFHVPESNDLKTFSDTIVKAEPTFPIEKNLELLRVMATAACYISIDESTDFADVLALGLSCSTFIPERISPVCSDITVRGFEHLAEKCESLRPQIKVGQLEHVEKKIESTFAALKKAVETNSPTEVGKATESLARQLLNSVRESHSTLADGNNRVAEESQYLWWLTCKKSPLLKKRRSELSAKEYAVCAAIEAADRVTQLPPASSVESIIEEVISQCAKDDKSKIGISDIPIRAEIVERIPNANGQELTPLVALIELRKRNLKPDADFFKRIRLSPKAKMTAVEISQQIFRELMYLRALSDLS